MPSTVEGRKRELGKDLYIVHWAVIIINQANSKDTQNKTKQNTKPNNKNKTSQNPTHKNDWHPVHWWIHAGDGSFVSSHPSMAKTTRKQTKKQAENKHTPGHTQR